MSLINRIGNWGRRHRLRLGTLTATAIASGYGLVVWELWWPGEIWGAALVVAPWATLAFIWALVRGWIQKALGAVWQALPLVRQHWRVMVLAILPLAAWGYYVLKVNIVGRMDAAALMFIWALLVYLWWPRRIHLDLPWVPAPWWARLGWGILKFGFLAFLVGFATGAAVRTGSVVITTAALMVDLGYLLFAWGPRPHPIHWPLPPGPVRLPVPRRLSIPFALSLAGIEATVLGTTAYAVWRLGWSPATLLLGIGVAYLCFMGWAESFKLTYLLWQEVVINLSIFQFSSDTAMLGAGSTRQIDTARLGGITKVDTPLSVDLLQRATNCALYTADVIGAPAEPFRIITRGARWPSDPQEAARDPFYRGPWLRDEAAVTAALAWFARLRPLR